MGLKVAFMSDEAIERDAEALLADYARERGVRIEAPIPIEDIIEKHLKIGVEFDDTHRLFGVPRSGIGFDPDILGAIFFDQKRIVIDESLDPETNPAKEGRYRFTLAHEGGGHWRLHRHLFGKDPAQTSLLDPAQSHLYRALRLGRQDLSGPLRGHRADRAMGTGAGRDGRAQCARREERQAGFRLLWPDRLPCLRLRRGRRDQEGALRLLPLHRLCR